MAIPRIILGNKDLPTESGIPSGDAATDGIFYPPGQSSQERIKYYLAISKDQAAGWRNGHSLSFRQSSTGVARVRIILESGFDVVKGPWVIIFGYGGLNSSFFPIMVTNDSLVARGTAGLYVSSPGIDVTNNAIAHSGNLIFDSSTYVESSMFVVQQGSAILAGYKHRRDPVFHAGNRTNVSIDFSVSKSPGTKNIIPIVMLQFAVCNSSGHFHPNYADSANTKELLYMDSIWIKQLNVIGGTINTEHQTLNFIDSYIQKGKTGGDADFNYGSMGESGAGFGPAYPGQDFPHGTIHGMSLGADTGSATFADEDLTGAPEAAAGGEYYGKHPWAALNAKSKPNNYPRTQWETLVRPDGWHINLNNRGGGSDGNPRPISEFTPQSYAQMEAPFGSIDRRINKSINKTQYLTPGRTGYWKQKTWGLIYYVDNDKLIIQAWNDKSTSNAMISTNNANAHYNAWKSGKGDKGRIIASDYSGTGPGAGTYPNHGLNIMDASTDWNAKHPYVDNIRNFWPTRHFSGHTGHGAFNHDLAYQEEDLGFPFGAGSSIFDYYHDPGAKGSYNQSGNQMWEIYGRGQHSKHKFDSDGWTVSDPSAPTEQLLSSVHIRESYLPRSGWNPYLVNGMMLSNEAPADVRYWPPEHRIMLQEYLKTGSYTYRGASNTALNLPFSSMYAESAAGRTAVGGLGLIPYEETTDPYNFYPHEATDWNFPDGKGWLNLTGETQIPGYYAAMPLAHPGLVAGTTGYGFGTDPKWIGQYNNCGQEISRNRAISGGGTGINLWEPGSNLSSNFGHPESNNGWTYEGTPAEDFKGRTWQGDENTVAVQEHMPRSYMGGWDNFLWDNVPLKNFLITQLWGNDQTAPSGNDYHVYNSGNYSQISPWMTFSNCIQNMELWPNGYPLWYKASLEETRHGYGSMWWFLKGELEGRTKSFSTSSDPGSFPRYENVPTADAGRGTPITLPPHTYDNQFQSTYPNEITGIDTPVGPGARINNTHDFRYRPWIEIDSKRTGYLSYREAIVPNTEVTTISTNHFNPMDKIDGEGAPYPDPYQWDYFFVSYIVFNQGTGIVHDPLIRQTNTGVFEVDVEGTATAQPNWPLDPWTGQPLHD